METKHIVGLYDHCKNDKNILILFGDTFVLNVCTLSMKQGLIEMFEFCCFFVNIWEEHQK